MREIYDRVPWFRELAGKIAEGGEAYLIEKARRVTWGGENPALLRYGDEGIDPFSFFHFLASKNTRKQWKPVGGSVRDVFGIESPLPDYCTLPTPKGFNVLFHGGRVFHFGLLWRLFRQVVQDAPTVAGEDFQKILQIKNVGVAKLTQTLFLINPDYFLPIDHTTKAIPALQPDIKYRIRDRGYKEYEYTLDKLKGTFPGCQPYEINMFLRLQQEGRGINAGSKFFQVSTQAYGNDEPGHWENFKENNCVYAGGPGSGKEWTEEGDYPLTQPKRGDIILVRTGRKQGRAIGIVQKNDYAESGLNENSRIHVNHGLTTFVGKHVNHALLFPMEEVFEDFVASCFRRYRQSFFVHRQGPQKPLAGIGGKDVFYMRPDISLIERGDGVRFILDTKWKRINEDDSDLKHGISQADMYQLFAYGKKYGCKQVALVYPKTKDFQNPLLYRFDDKLSLMCFPFDVTEPEESVRKIIGCLSSPRQMGINADAA